MSTVEQLISTIESEFNITISDNDKVMKIVRKLVNCKKSKKVSIKDENSPKKGKSAYIFFCSENRQSVKDENPEMKSTEILSELGRQWREMSEKEKQPFVNKALKDKERYELEKKGECVVPKKVKRNKGDE